MKRCLAEENYIIAPDKQTVGFFPPQAGSTVSPSIAARNSVSKLPRISDPHHLVYAVLQLSRPSGRLNPRAENSKVAPSWIEEMKIRCENCNGLIEVPTEDPSPTMARQEPMPLEGNYTCPHCRSVIQVLRTVDGGYYMLLLSIGAETDTD